MSSRIDQLQATLVEQGLDGAVLRLPENVLLLSTYYQQVPGMALVVVPREGPGVLLVPSYEVEEAERVWRGRIETFNVIRNDLPPPNVDIARVLSALGEELGLAGGEIGVESSFETLAPPSMAGEPFAVGEPTRELYRSALRVEGGLIDLTEPLEQLRAVKTPDEIERLRTVNEVAALGLQEFKRVALPGRTEVEVMADVERAVAVGATDLPGVRVARAWATVYSGPDLAENGWQYFRSRARTIEVDDVVMLEMGTTADGYWADHTRTVVAGRATDRQRAAFEAVVAANAAAFAAAIPGATGGEVDAATRSSCRDAGFEQFPHHTGHGVGFRYHESRPQLVPGGEHELSAGNVIAVEPGIYDPELEGGFRHEDNAVVTDEGAEVLCETSFGLDFEDR